MFILSYTSSDISDKMMQDEDEEDTMFDQTHLLGQGIAQRPETFCQKLVKTVGLCGAFFGVVSINYLS